MPVLNHNARTMAAQGATPAFYLPKLESRLEARLWNDAFTHAEERLGLPKGAFKATILIETLPAAFEMDEILYELRDHIAGLNCGRWDYIFSFIKKFNKNPNYILPDRSQVVMGKAFLRAYALLLAARGAKIVVVDPVRTRTAEAADWHLPIKPASDAVLALAMMHVIIRDGLVDHDYVSQYAVGYEALAERIRDLPVLE